MEAVRVPLMRSSFGEKEREAATASGLTASIFKYGTGVEAVGSPIPEAASWSCPIWARSCGAPPSTGSN